jgi:hypothetical protein
VRQNILAHKREIATRNQELNERDKQRDEQIQNSKMRRTIQSLKQREIDHLRYNDYCENLGQLKNHRFLENCEIVEKHLALSILNNDRK